MLNLAVRNTRKLIREKSQTEGIRIGNRFTKKPTAALYAKYVKETAGDVVTLLDAGAGTGILTAAVTEALCKMGKKEIYATVYETNEAYLPMLENNMRRIRRKCHHDYGVKFRFTMKGDLLSAYGEDATDAETYDVVVSNPPDELAEDLPSREAFHVPVSRAFHFFDACLSAVKPGGQLLIAAPTSFATAASLDIFRKKVLDSFCLDRVHLFSVKGKKEETTGERNDVLKKTMLLSLVNRAPSDTLYFSTSYDDGETSSELSPLPFDYLVRGEEKRIVLLQSEDELALLRFMELLPTTLENEGLRMRTGLVLESRYPELFSDRAKEGYIPMLSPRGIASGHVNFPLPYKNQYILPRIPSLSQKNKNMLLLKRVPSKADKRHLFAAVYLASQFPHAETISTQNKLVYIEYANGDEPSAPYLYGLYTLFNSTLYERYCTILSKSTQVNASEYRSLPLPDRKTVEALGAKMMMTRQYSAKVCDVLVKNLLMPKSVEQKNANDGAVSE